MLCSVRCRCSQCSSMPTIEESIYRQELNTVTATCSEDTEQPVACITEHPAFRSVCLDKWVLKVAYLTYAQNYGHVQEQEIHR